VLWPYKPLDGMIESFDWLTEVMQPKSAEQRLALRVRSRRSFAFEHVMTQQEYSAAKAMVRGATAFFVPDWGIGPVYAGATTSGLDVSLAVDTTDLDIEAGSKVGFQFAPGRWEVCTIKTVSPAAIVLESVTNAVSVAGVYLLQSAHVATQMESQRGAGQHVVARINFETLSGPLKEGGTYPQYRGHDVMTDIPVVGDGELDEIMAQQVEVIDNSIGFPLVLTARNYAESRTAMRWQTVGKANARTLRKWIFSRRGRQKVFWRSTWMRDLVVADTVTSSSTVIPVFLPGSATSLGRTAFDIEINGLQLYRRRVTNVTPAADIGGRAVVNLTIDTSLGANHLASQIGRVSYLECLRFDADRIEFLHRAGGLMAVAVPCVEVPVP